MTLVCLSCGADDNRDTAKFCKACGKPLPHESVLAQAAQPFASPARPDGATVGAVVAPPNAADPFESTHIYRRDEQGASLPSAGGQAAAPSPTMTALAVEADPAAVFVAPPADAAIVFPSAAVSQPWSPPADPFAWAGASAPVAASTPTADVVPPPRPRPFSLLPPAPDTAQDLKAPAAAPARHDWTAGESGSGGAGRWRPLVVSIAAVALAGLSVWGVWKWAGSSSRDDADERVSSPSSSSAAAAATTPPQGQDGTVAGAGPASAVAVADADSPRLDAPAIEPPENRPSASASLADPVVEAQSKLIPPPVRPVEAGKPTAAKSVAKPVFGMATPAAAPPPSPPSPVEPVAPPPPAPVVTVMPSGPGSPQEACQAAGMFGRSACLSEQCTKPAFASHSQCKRWRLDRQQEEQQRLYGGGGS